MFVSPDPSKPFMLHTDASGVGIWSIVSQKTEKNTDQPIAYFSRRLRASKSYYTVTELECLAVEETVRHFRVYLSRPTFAVVTDHRSLRYLDRMMDENVRLTRLLLALQPCPSYVEHRPGIQHQNADGLSGQSSPGAVQKKNQMSCLLIRREMCHRVTSVSRLNPSNIQ